MEEGREGGGNKDGDFGVVEFVESNGARRKLREDAACKRSGRGSAEEGGD